jgi:hypothetical protein
MPDPEPERQSQQNCQGNIRLMRLSQWQANAGEEFLCRVRNECAEAVR